MYNLSLHPTIIPSNTLPNLSIPDANFPVLLSTVMRSRFQAKPEILLIPTDFFLFLLVEEFYGTQYQNGNLSPSVGVWFFTAYVLFSFSFF